MAHYKQSAINTPQNAYIRTDRDARNRIKNTGHEANSINEHTYLDGILIASEFIKFFINVTNELTGGFV